MVCLIGKILFVYTNNTFPSVLGNFSWESGTFLNLVISHLFWWKTSTYLSMLYHKGNYKTCIHLLCHVHLCNILYKVIISHSRDCLNKYQHEIFRYIHYITTYPKSKNTNTWEQSRVVYFIYLWILSGDCDHIWYFPARLVQHVHAEIVISYQIILSVSCTTRPMHLHIKLFVHKR